MNLSIKTNYGAFNTPNTQIKKQNSNTLPDESKINNNLQQLAEIGKSQINFQGRFFRLNKRDLMFLNGLVTAFGLSTVTFEKLKTVLTKYLQENNFSSMEDFGGEDFIEEQAILTEKLNEVLKLEEKDYNKLNYRIIERCDAGDFYNPGENDMNIEFMEKMMGEAGAIIRKVEAENDQKMLNAFAKAFSLNSEETNKLYKIVTNTLKENHLKTLCELYKLEYAEELGVMFEQIAREFHLPEDAIEAMSDEFMHRFTDCKPHEYTPQITRLDLNQHTLQEDRTVLTKILNNYEIKRQDLINLHSAIRQDTIDNNLDSIFELFDKNKNEKYPKTMQVLNSKNFENIKEDLLIDLHQAKKNKNKILDKIENNDINRIINLQKQYAVIARLDAQKDLSKEEFLLLNDFFKKTRLQFDDKKQIWQQLYDFYEKNDIKFIKISELYNIIEEINQCDNTELIQYHMQYLKLFKKHLLKQK